MSVALRMFWCDNVCFCVNCRSVVYTMDSQMVKYRFSQLLHCFTKVPPYIVQLWLEIFRLGGWMHQQNASAFHLLQWQYPLAKIYQIVFLHVSPFQVQFYLLIRWYVPDPESNGPGDAQHNITKCIFLCASCAWMCVKSQTTNTMCPQKAKLTTF